MSGVYIFTHEQLCKMLDEAIGMYQELKGKQYNTQQARDECKLKAINEMIEGLEAEREQALCEKPSQVIIPEKAEKVIMQYAAMKEAKP